MTQGRTYTARAVIKVAADTKQDSYTWRFFCESKWFNPKTNVTEFKYPFDNQGYPDGKVFMTVRVLTAARRDGLVSLLPIAPILSNLSCHLPQIPLLPATSTRASTRGK